MNDCDTNVYMSINSVTKNNSDKRFSFYNFNKHRNQTQFDNRQSTVLLLTEKLQLSEVAAFCFCAEVKSFEKEFQQWATTHPHYFRVFLLNSFLRDSNLCEASNKLFSVR